MSQVDNIKQLKVKLFKEDETDYLEFHLDTKVHRLNVNLEDNQEKIKAMFCDVIPILEKTDIQFILEVAEGYDNKLLEEVASSYLTDLNKEAANVRGDILEDGDEDE